MAIHDPTPVPAFDLERVLARVRKPGRYAGGEWNSVVKDWSTVTLKWCFGYPDLYEIGMSNLGLRILYEILNDRPDCLAERCFAPDVDLQAELRAASVPLWSLESRRALRDFDVLGISLGYELTYTNLLDMLDLGGVGITSAERTLDQPLVIAGGSAVLNPEPISDSLDAVLLGEGEEAVVEISELLERLGWHRRREEPAGLTRAGVLRKLARIPGVYVPSLYRAEYQPDGSFARLTPLDDAPATITSRIVADFETHVRGIRQLVPNIGIVFDRAQLEVMRGCTRGCRFCQAGMGYRPLRERAPDVAVDAAVEILQATGYEEIGLTSLSTADYTYVDEVGAAIRRLRPDTTISLPSTRVDAFTVELADALAPSGRRGSFTFAPEAGSQHMRDVINKGVTDEEILRCAELAFRHGWSGLKLYFMIGLPGETIADVLAIADLCRRILEVGRKHHGGNAQVKANVSTFVPKVATPFQWAGQDSTETIEAKVAALRKSAHGRGLDLRWNDPRSSMLEAALGRGDRRLNAVVRRAWQSGARFDAWDEHFAIDRWLEAFVAEGLDPAWFAGRRIGLDQPLPWGHLDCGVSRENLAREYKKALTGKTSADCHWGPCYKCGVPDATGFDCETGKAGPRSLLRETSTAMAVSTDQETELRDGKPVAAAAARWRYVGPPGDSRRGRWPYDLLGSELQSKNAGLAGLASLVEAAGGETGG